MHLLAILSTLTIQQHLRTVPYIVRDQLMSNDEHLLADKAYQLERHIITHIKNRPPDCAAMLLSTSYLHSTTRAQIEHAFGILKARWTSLHKPGLPIRIGEDVQRDHKRISQWILACIVLHNILHEINEDGE